MFENKLTVEETNIVLEAIRKVKDSIYNRTEKDSKDRGEAKCGLRGLCERFNFPDW